MNKKVVYQIGGHFNEAIKMLLYAFTDPSAGAVNIIQHNLKGLNALKKINYIQFLFYFIKNIYKAAALRCKIKSLTNWNDNKSANVH